MSPLVWFWERRLHPVALGMAMSGLTIFWVNLRDVGYFGTTWVGDMVGWIALAYAVLLAAGWVTRRTWLLAAGMLVAFGVWFARAILVLLQTGWAERGVYLSLAWAVIAGGSFWLEKADPEGIRSGVRRIR